MQGSVLMTGTSEALGLACGFRLRDQTRLKWQLQPFFR
jgi:hypothetical protein